jgi:uncharacterized protein DUF2442
MLIHVVEAKYISGYKIWLKFDTVDEGEVDLTDVLLGKVFEPLKDQEIFRRFTVDSKAGTIVAPESLYRRAKASNQIWH